MNLKYKVALLYVALIIISNFLLTKYIVNFNDLYLLSWGALTFGIVFFLRDLMHKHDHGLVYLCILVGIGFSVIYNIISNNSFNTTIAMAAALAVGEIADTLVFERTKSRNWVSSAMRSNLVSIPLFCVVLNVIHLFGTQNQDKILGFVIGDIIVMTLVASFFTFVYFFAFKKGEILNFHQSEPNL